MISASVISTVTPACLASFVAVVEAFTIVLAVGLTRGWRPALTGAGLALLVALVAAFGSLFRLRRLQAPQFVPGALVLLFGMRWLRKAILPSAWVIALPDEAGAFARKTDFLARQPTDRRADQMA